MLLPVRRPLRYSRACTTTARLVPEDWSVSHGGAFDRSWFVRHNRRTVKSDTPSTFCGRLRPQTVESHESRPSGTRPGERFSAVQPRGHDAAKWRKRVPTGRGGSRSLVRDLIRRAGPRRWAVQPRGHGTPLAGASPRTMPKRRAGTNWPPSRVTSLGIVRTSGACTHDWPGASPRTISSKRCSLVPTGRT